MKTIHLLLFLLSFKTSAFSISFWNLQNFFGASGLHNLEYVPINHPLKKAFCLRKKTAWEKKTCLYTHWTELKASKRSALFKQEIALFPESDLWCFSEIENYLLAKSLQQEGENRFIFGLAKNVRGQNIFCSLAHKYKANYISSKPLFLRDSQRYALEIHMRFKDRDYYLIVVHLPSQFHEDRERAYAMNKLLERYLNRNFIFLGDFNMRPSEFSNYSEHAVNWQRSDLKGTYFYRKDKSYLHFDNFLSNLKNLEAKILLPKLRDTYRGVLVPQKFSFRTEKGLSDHFPIRLEVKSWD